MSIKTMRPRPYWHVDFKWASGVLLFLFLGGALFFYNISSLTQRDKAVNISATIVASLFSKDGLDDENSVAEFRKKVAATPGDRVVPMEQFPSITVSRQDALSLSPRDLRVAIFRQLTEVIYDNGLAGGVAIISSDPQQQKKFKKDAVLLNFFTRTTHETFQKLFIICSGISLALGVLLIYFSAGWGRLVSPAVVLLAVSPVGSIAGLLILTSSQKWGGPITVLPANVIQDIGANLSQSYIGAAVVAVVLLFIASLGRITQKRSAGRKMD